MSTEPRHLMSDDNLCMIRYYKWHVFALKIMLNSLDPSHANFEPLVKIQNYLVELILSTERKIKNQQALRKRLKSLLRKHGSTKARSNEIKRKMARCTARIDGYKFLLFVWRCFGDGIAHKYVSKWNLKRLFYAHGSAEMKQHAGYLGGKAGIRSEHLLMLSAISHGVPAILCDLTNVIRHGDVCLLGAADPHVIEVKSSNNISRRTSRQVEAIETIHSYFENDVGDVGGVPSMQRVVLPILDKHHNLLINEVADKAIVDGWSMASPEEGLYYIAVKSGAGHPPFEALFDEIEDPFIFLLNEAKTEQAWGNYYPFTLSLREPHTLYAFLRGEIILIVAISQASLKSRAAKIGFELSVVMSEDVGFELLNLKSTFNNGVPYVVSEHFVGRLAFEFLSLEWFFENEKILLADLEEHLKAKSDNA